MKRTEEDEHPRPAINVTNVEHLARHMFQRQADSYDSDPALVELAWVDPDIRAFWMAEAISVLAYLEELAA
ncbi:hypothetical protein [Nocardioides astragali]|uniref:Uncharacterized protein n=1 Tax=Nocardioides astragali TaxID=1776736 RepID=A0ABW2N834_9ACTN|nr:hypothetical protein [Nocardioides astragali]